MEPAFSKHLVMQDISIVSRMNGYLFPVTVWGPELVFYFYIYLQSFDQKKNGRFRLDDFISLCIFVQSAR